MNVNSALRVVLKTGGGDVSTGVLSRADQAFGFFGGARSTEAIERHLAHGFDLHAPTLHEGQVGALVHEPATGGLNIVPMELDAIPGLGSTQLFDMHVSGVSNWGEGTDNVVGLLQRDSNTTQGWRLLTRPTN